MKLSGFWASGDSYLVLVKMLLVGPAMFVLVKGVDHCHSGASRRLMLCNPDEKAFCFYGQCNDKQSYVDCAGPGFNDRESVCNWVEDECQHHGGLKRCYLCNSEDGCNDPNNPKDEDDYMLNHTNSKIDKSLTTTKSGTLEVEHCYQRENSRLYEDPWNPVLCNPGEKSFCYYAECNDKDNSSYAGCDQFKWKDPRSMCDHISFLCKIGGSGLKKCSTCNTGDGCNNPENPIDQMLTTTTIISTTTQKTEKPSTSTTIKKYQPTPKREKPPTLNPEKPPTTFKSEKVVFEKDEPGIGSSKEEGENGVGMSSMFSVLLLNVGLLLALGLKKILVADG